MSLHLTVHHFNVDSSPPPSLRLLENARQLVDAATARTSDWRSISLASAVRPSYSGTSIGSCFVWDKAPPVVDRSLSTAHEKLELYDWDDPIEDEITCLDFLLEFEQTDFIDILLYPKSRFTRRTRSNSPPRSSRYAARHMDTNSAIRPRKRLSSRMESLSPPSITISISRLIPFPHYYESLDPASPPPPGIANIPEFPVAQSLTSSASLTTPFARTAWLVPLRGSPPIDGASPAQLDSYHSCELLPRDGTSSRTIQWTPAGVTQFWIFLLRQRNMNNFGPISFAYMFSPHSMQKRQRKERDERWNKKLKDGDIYGEGEGKQAEKQKGASNLEEKYSDEPAGISVWEYIKIYHDSQYAMKLRSLLDSFRLEGDTNKDKEKSVACTTLPTQCRVLKATRLVLVDETGEAILLA